MPNDEAMRKARKAADDAEIHARNVDYWNVPGVKRNTRGEPLDTTGGVLPRPGTVDESDIDFIKGRPLEPPTPAAPKPEPWMSQKPVLGKMHSGGRIPRSGLYNMQAGEKVIPRGGSVAKDPLWMEHAAKKMKTKGTAGSFGRAAKAAGKSTAAFAQEKKSAGGKMGQKANMALAFAKARH